MESQVVQEAIGRFCIRIVPAREFCAADSERIKKNLRGDVGEATIDVELVDAIERTEGGKVLFLVCKLDPNRVGLQETTGNATVST